MAKVVAIMSMSLDGYVADVNDGVAEVFDWYFSGDVEVPMPDPDTGLHVPRLGAERRAPTTSRAHAPSSGIRRPSL